MQVIEKEVVHMPAHLQSSIYVMYFMFSALASHFPHEINNEASLATLDMMSLFHSFHGRESQMQRWGAQQLSHLCLG